MAERVVDETMPPPTFQDIAIHEARVVGELLVLNLGLCLMTYYLGIPYEVIFPFLILLLIRTKRYDDNVFDDPFPISLHLGRVLLVGVLLAVHTFILGSFTVERTVDAGEPPRLANLIHGNLLLEQTFLSMLFCLTVLTMRFFCQLALLCSATIESIRPAGLWMDMVNANTVGPGGDAQPRVRVTMSQIFPALDVPRHVRVNY